MKPLNELQNELAEKSFWDNHPQGHLLIIKNIWPQVFNVGFNSATDLVFNRIVDALDNEHRNDNFTSMDDAIQWLVENKERILK